MKFELIPADKLSDVWDYVRPGIERVREKGKARWIAEEVFAAVYRGRAGLFLGIEDGKRRGFIVTEMRRDDQGLPVLNVWILYAEPTVGEHFADVKDYMAETVAFLDEHAKQMKASRTIIKGGRSGWERMLKGYFEPVTVEYERVTT